MTSHSPNERATNGARLSALKQQIHTRNTQMLPIHSPSARTDTIHSSIDRRHSLLRLHQQQMELMPSDALDPFASIEAKEDGGAPSNYNGRRRVYGRDKSVSKTHTLRSHNPTLSSTFLTDTPDDLPVIDAAHSTKSVSQSRPRRVRMSASLKSLLADMTSMSKADEERIESEDDETVSRVDALLSELQQQFRSGSVAATLKSSSQSLSSLSLPSPSSSKFKSTNRQSLTNSTNPSTSTNTQAPLTPRLTFSRSRVEKFNDSVKVMMALSHTDMENIRTAILKYGGGVTRAQFLAIANRKDRNDDGYSREVEALVEMFDEIDVNGDGDLQYGELTSYLVELANGRYDHHHIDQLLHSNYHSLEPIVNDDHIDVINLKYHDQIKLFTMFEKGQHRFKILDYTMKTVRVVRGHSGALIDAEYLPLHGVLVTSASDRTLKFWSIDESDNANTSTQSLPLPASKTKSANGGYPERYAPVNKRSTKATRRDDSNSTSSGDAYPTFTCISTWSLPSPQMCLCWYKTRLYSGDILGRLLVWNIDVGEIKASLHAHNGPITHILAVNDRGWLATSGVDNRVRIWDLQDLHEVASYQHEASVRSLCYDTSRGLVFSGGDDDVIIVYSCQDKEVVRSYSFDTGATINTSSSITDKKSIPSKSESKPGRLRLKRDVNRVEEKDSRDEYDINSRDSILGLTVTGDEVLIISQFGVMRVLDCHKWTIEQTLILPRVFDESSAFDDDDEEVVDDSLVASDESKEPVSMRARELVTSWAIIKALPKSSQHSHNHSHAHLHSVSQSVSSPHTENIFIACSGSALYPFTRNSAVNKFVADHHSIIAAVYNPNNFTVLTAAHRSIKIWDCITGRLLKEFHDITARHCPITSVCLDARFRKLIVSSSDGIVKLFNCNTGAEMQSLERHSGEVNHLLYIDQTGSGTLREDGSVESNKILCSCQSVVYIHHDDHEASVASSSYTSLYHSSEDHRGEVTSIVYSTSMKLIASASVDRTVIIYPDNLDGTPLQKLTVSESIAVIRFIEPYQLLLVATVSNTLLAYLYNNHENCLIGSVSLAIGGTVNDMKFDLSSSVLYTADEAGTINQWELDTALIRPYKQWKEFVDNRKLANKGIIGLRNNEMPDEATLSEYFGSPRLFAALQSSLTIHAHHGSCNTIEIVPGRSPVYSQEAERQRQEREVRVQAEEDEWKEKMRINYDTAVITTARVLYESQNSGTNALVVIESKEQDTRSETSTNTSSDRVSSALLSLNELRQSLSPDAIKQLEKESRRVARLLQNEHDKYFTARRQGDSKIHSNHLHELNLQYGSPTVLLSAGDDGCVSLWSVENGERLGSLHQGNVATLGMSTQPQWKFYVNMEARKAEERERLVQSIGEMEQAREEYQQLINEQKLANTASDSYYEEGENDMLNPVDDALPSSRATHSRERRLLSEAELSLKEEINSDEFQLMATGEQSKSGARQPVMRDHRQSVRNLTSAMPLIPDYVPLSQKAGYSRLAKHFPAATDAGDVRPMKTLDRSLPLSCLASASRRSWPVSQ